MSETREWGYESGRRYRLRQAQSPSDYLDAAVRAGRYIDRFSKQTPNGVCWTIDDENGIGKPFLNLADGQNNPLSVYDGAAGICYFFLKLYAVTGKEQYRQTVLRSVEYIASHWREAVEKPAPGPGGHTFHDGTFAGIGGLAYIFAEVYETLKDPLAERVLHGIIDQYARNAQRNGNETYWSGTPSPSADGGIILMLLEYQRLFSSQQVDGLIRSTGEWYLRVGADPSTNGYTFGPAFSLPNFEGTAGCGYILLKLYEYLQDDRYLTAALNIEQWLQDRFVAFGKGRLLPFRLLPDNSVSVDPQGNPICYVGLCNGPAGTAKFYYELTHATGDQAYLTVIDDMFASLDDLQVPERQSPGLWNNVSYCCGHAGLLQTLIGLYESTHEDKWHDLMVRTAAVLLGQAEERFPGTYDWPEAFERSVPEAVSRDIGFFPGAAGIGSALLQMYLSESGHFHWRRWPDDPFTRGHEPAETTNGVIE